MLLAVDAVCIKKFSKIFIMLLYNDIIIIIIIIYDFSLFVH